MTLGDAARRVRPVDGRMLFAVLVGLFLAVMVEGPACALEFTADLIMHANGKTHVSNLYYRDDRWRLEHQDIICTTGMIAGVWNIRTLARSM